MFNEDSLNAIQTVIGSGGKKKKKKKSVLSSKHSVDKNTVIVEPDEQDLILFKELMVQGARWGMYLAHREMAEESRISMLKGLWKKNRPDEEMPENVFCDEVTDSIDSDSGKCFAELCEEAMINDWANQPHTIPTIEKLESISSNLNPPAFMKCVTECVEKMKEDYRGALQMKSISDRIN